MVYEVIVDISSSETDRIYDYTAEFDIPCGSRVLAPFGKRKIEGFVIGTKLKTKHQTKNIIKILDDKPVIIEEMLELAKYLNEQKNLRLIDVIRLCIPSKLRGGKVGELKKAYITLTDKELIETIPKRAKAQKEIANLLKESGEYESVLNKKYSPQSVKSLIEKGIAKREYIRQIRTPYKSIATKAKKINLTSMQKVAVNEILKKEGEYLIHGVTGSGKTEIYMKIIEEELKREKTAIMLVPEISLTPQMLGLFRARFGEKVSLLHSGLSDGERFDEWQRLLYGEAKVALGARSAIFAPLKDVGVIIIDEEHDTSYVSESNPRYFTQDIAKFRKDYNSSRLIYGSATPSLETYKRAKEGEYKLITLKTRVNERNMPEMEIVDMRKEIREGNMSIFSKVMLKELHKAITEGNQAMLFINRRGFASFVRCRKCGYIPQCTDCEVSLTLHKDDNKLKCHYCGKQFYNIDECPKCGFKHLKEGRIGTEKVVEELKKIYPEVKVARMDNDTVRTKNSYVDILSDFSEGKYQILVGTQMIVKGHDFKDVTLVGIL
ncbi:MAG: replication restart helicase PriA, partial [Bacillota bacterium]